MSARKKNKNESLWIALVLLATVVGVVCFGFFVMPSGRGMIGLEPLKGLPSFGGGSRKTEKKPRTVAFTGDEIQKFAGSFTNSQEQIFLVPPKKVAEQLVQVDPVEEEKERMQQEEVRKARERRIAALWPFSVTGPWHTGREWRVTVNGKREFSVGAPLCNGDNEWLCEILSIGRNAVWVVAYREGDCVIDETIEAARKVKWLDVDFIRSGDGGKTFRIGLANGGVMVQGEQWFIPNDPNRQDVAPGDLLITPVRIWWRGVFFEIGRYQDDSAPRYFGCMLVER